MEEYKVIIIGAGISGMSCAIYLKRAGISTLLIESNAPGGQLNKINVIENYPGYFFFGNSRDDSFVCPCHSKFC